MNKYSFFNETIVNKPTIINKSTIINNMEIAIPTTYVVDPVATKCPIRRENWADNLLTSVILTDNSVFQVMGSYALAAVVPKTLNFTPNDCDVFVTAESKTEFWEKFHHVANQIHGKCRAFGVNVEFLTITEWLSSVNICFDSGVKRVFQFIWIDSTRYTHVQVANMFDITCCMFRMVVGADGNLEVYANNTYVKMLTLDDRSMNVYDSSKPERCDKYFRRGFEINKRVPYLKMTPCGNNAVFVRGGIYEFLSMRRNMRVPWLALRFLVKMKIVRDRVMRRTLAKRFNEMVNIN